MLEVKEKKRKKNKHMQINLLERKGAIREKHQQNNQDNNKKNRQNGKHVSLNVVDLNMNFPNVYLHTIKI